MTKLLDKYNIQPDDTRIPFADLLTEEQDEQLKNNLNYVKYRDKDVIFRQGTRTSNVMFVKSGLVKIYKDGRNEKTIILKVASGGNFIGLMSVFGEEVYQYSASAVGECEVCDIDLAHFRSVLRENGKYALQFIKVLSQEGLFIFDRLMTQSHKQLPGRIADVILYFAEEVYKSHEFSFPFTRRELADLAGTTKESFIRTLTEFKNDKIIEIEGSKVKIRSIDIIRTLSNLG